MQSEKKMKPLGIICQGGSFRHLQGAASMAATAIAIGRDAHILWTHEALFSLLEGDLEELTSGFGDAYGEIYDDAREAGRIVDPRMLLEQAKKKGNLKQYACSASVKLRRGYELAALNSLDGIIGHASFLTWGSDWQLVYLA